GSAGTPARFEQQPAPEDALIHASGRIIVYDNESSFLTIDVEAQLEQAGNTVRGHHIDYDLAARTFKASGSEQGEQVRMIILPGTVERSEQDDTATAAQAVSPAADDTDDTDGADTEAGAR